MSASRRPLGETTVDSETASGHDSAMKHAKVAELRAHLSAYLAQVRKGGTGSYPIDEHQSPGWCRSINGPRA